jgi:hypothetical protein
MSESIDPEFLAQQIERILAELAAIRMNDATMRAELAGIRTDNVGIRTELAGVRAEMSGMRVELASLRDAISTMNQATDVGFASIRSRLDPH